MSTPPHRTLWERSLALAEACRATPFVCGLARGTLPPEAFRRYVAQDAFFLRAFFAAYAVAAARAAEAGRMDAARRLHGLMAGVLEELELHEGYAASLDIDLEGVTPNAAARGYTEFLADAAWTDARGGAQDGGDGPGLILAAMTPCMRLYAWLGRRLAAEGAETGDNPYREWIETYASPEFETLAAELEALLDELAEGSDVEAAAYEEAMRHELAFFNAFA